jgi:alkanesulfonate monooxygenase SsuD/methylene tetrahydromethanopterin reductase-like flavin-dependent oxidoreductase (luciferase family)
MAQVGAGAASPMALLREQTAAIRALLAGETVTTAGKYVQLDGGRPGLAAAAAPRRCWSARAARRRCGWPPSWPTGWSWTRSRPSTAARDRLAVVREGRAAAERTDEPFRAVVYVEVDPTTPDLAGELARRAAEFGDIGATSVVFQAPEGAPDPRPLIDALGRGTGVIQRRTQVSLAPPPRDELTIMLPAGAIRLSAAGRTSACGRPPRRDCSTNARRSTARGSSLPSANVG